MTVMYKGHLSFRNLVEQELLSTAEQEQIHPFLEVEDRLECILLALSFEC
jgi:hypothetical protein